MLTLYHKLGLYTIPLHALHTPPLCNYVIITVAVPKNIVYY